MTASKKKYLKWTIITGSIFLSTYLFQDFLWDKMWIWSFFLMLLFGLIFIVVITVAFLKKDKRVISVFVAVILVAIVTEILKSEAFKSEKVLEARLHDELSVINLTLRKNRTFEISAVGIFSEQSFKGKYKIINDKIIFLDKPYDNGFIPDTVTMSNDKIILRFDKNNRPVIDFATYFNIRQNHLENSP